VKAGDTARMQRRIDELEARLARLEGRLDTELPEIPWHVVTAAVAAALPHGHILSIKPVRERVFHSSLNFWSVGGRFDHFESHRIR
jgi:hypothetical protein